MARRADGGSTLAKTLASSVLKEEVHCLDETGADLVAGIGMR